MTGSVERLHSMIISKEHHVHRTDPDLDMAEAFAAGKVPAMARVARRTVAVLAAEKAVILEGERICFLRTVRKLPDLFTAEEWEGIRSGHFIHELGHVCNISPDYGSCLLYTSDAADE